MTIFSLSMEMSRLTRDGNPSRETEFSDAYAGKGNIHFPCVADHVQDWQPYPADPYSCFIDRFSIKFSHKLMPKIQPVVTRLYICMYEWSSNIARVRINRVRLPILLVVS